MNLKTIRNFLKKMFFYKLLIFNVLLKTKRIYLLY